MEALPSLPTGDGFNAAGSPSPSPGMAGMSLVVESPTAPGSSSMQQMMPMYSPSPMPPPGNPHDANLLSPPRASAAHGQAPGSSARKKADGSGGGARAKKALVLDENGQPVPKKVRKRPAPQVDPITGEVIKRKRKRPADAAAGPGEEGAAAEAGGSGGKKKAARRRAAASAAAVDSPQQQAGGYDAPPSARTAGAYAPAALAGPGFGRVKGPFHKGIMELLSTSGGHRTALAESGSVLEEILVEFLATLTASMLSVPPVNISKDALQAAAHYSNSRDGSGVSATAVATAPALDQEALLLVLRANPAYHERAKEIFAAAADASQGAPSKK